MNFEKKNNIYKIIMVIIVTAIITFLISSAFFYNYYLKTDAGKIEALSKYLEISESTTLLEKKIEILKKYLENKYIGNLDEEKMVESALKGYVDGLGDRYTEYLTNEELEELLISVNGNYVGIGIYMTKDKEGNIIVLLPIPGSPAEEVGILPGDIIVKVNDIECKNLELKEVSDKVKGEEGTDVNLEILRDEEVLNITVQRRKVELQYIASEVLDDDIGYIQMIAFEEGCTEKLKEEIEKLKEKNVKSIVLDLRDNSGGLVTEAISASEIFVPFGKTILKSYDKDNNEKETKSNAISVENIPLVVLVNEESASATELFAAALQDNNIATIIGTKTYGKGIMQEVEMLKIGGALKITIEEFKTPNGNTINEVGISPDIEVEYSIGENDNQLQAAIEFLKNNVNKNYNKL